jgi:hypothetical protein
MLIVMKADHALKSGRIARKGESVDLPDAEAYKVVHAGAATPPVRYRVACETLLVGSRNCVRDDLVDVPAGTYDPARFHQLVAVVPSEEFARFDGSGVLTWAAGAPTFAPPDLAVEMVEKGGRYATQKEADALVWPEPHPSACRRKVLLGEIPAPVGPSKKVCFRVATEHASGVVVQPGDVLEVPVDEADALIKAGNAEPTVKVRVACDIAIVGGVNYSRGDVVEVGSRAAQDPDRFEPLDGRKPDDGPVPSNRFGS